MRTARLNTFRKPRGSVLIMALMMLVLMAGIVTAFLLSVRQQSKVATNASQTVQADGAAKAGLSHARSLLRQACQQYEIFTPDGIFFEDPTSFPAGGHTYLDPSAIAPNPLRVFEANPGDLTAASTIAQNHAWLYFDGSGSNVCGTTSLEPSALLYFTDSPLTNFSEPNGEIHQNYSGGPAHAGLARQFLVQPSSFTPLYAPLNIKHPLPRPAGVRGEYYVWIDDLDAKLHANPLEWGMDVSILPTTVPPETNITAATGICTKLSHYGDTTGFTSGSSYDGMQLATGTRISDLLTRPVGGAYSNIADTAAYLGVEVPPSGLLTANEYLAFRYGLERYFTVLKDNSAPTYVKNHEAALNINTASVETIAAAICRVPMVPGYDPSNSAKVDENYNKALALARRICAKRPFLCRVDFEDFVAAHINKVIAPFPATADDYADPTTPVGMIYLAIDSRIYSAAGVTLADLMEVPYPVPDSSTVYNGLMNKLWLKKRFEFFRDDHEPLAPIIPALLDEKGFNNLLNAVFGKLRNPISGSSYGWSFYSYDPEYMTATLPPAPVDLKIVQNEADFTTRLTTTAKFQYTPLTAADLPGQLTVAKLLKWVPTNHATWGGYYEMHWSNDEIQKVMPGTTSSTPDVVVTAGAGTPHTPPLNVPYALTSTDVVSGSDIQMASDGAVPTPTYTAHTLVHPKLRAYRMLADAANTAFTTPEASTSDVPDTTVAGPTHGDVAWAPQFAFRSRYYMIYVLARGQNTVYGTSVNSSWRRLQACYDALSDTVLWQRSQLTEKAALFEPEP